MSRKAIGLLPCIALALAGCWGEGGYASPAPSWSQDASGAETSVDASSGTTPPEAATDSAPQIKRTVLQRDPFGNYREGDNLLIDGDFEWTGGLMSSQTPWWVSPMLISWSAPDLLVGARCHSGMKCAVLSPSQSVAGAGVGTREPGLQLSAWIHPALPDCSLVSVSVGLCAGIMSAVHPIDSVSSTPDADGWCHFDGVVPAGSSRACVFVSNESDADDARVIVDDFVLRPASHAGSGLRRLPSPRHLAAVEQLRKGARELFQPRPPAWTSPPPVELRSKVR